MKLEITRTGYFGDSTVGELFVDNKPFCDTLEDKYREVKGQPVAFWKVEKSTAIPEGSYKVILNMSNRFKKILPLVLDVPGFTGIRIHSGNTDKDTEGCILVGHWNGHEEDFLHKSRDTFKELFNLMLDAVNSGEEIELVIT